MSNPKRLLVLLFLIQSAIFLLSACKQPLPKEDAEKHLRAFDNELISLMNSFQRTRSFSILQEILVVENVPVPFTAHKSENHGGTKKFDFNLLRGIYDFDSITGMFNLNSSSDSIIINYPGKVKGGQQIRLVITDYREEPSSSSLMFPTLINAFMYAGNREIARIIHFARVEHQLPVEAQTRIIFENYYLELDLTSRLRRKHANAVLEIMAGRDSEELFKCNVWSKLGFNEQGSIFLRSFQSKISAFPVFIHARVDNDAINSNAIDFIDEFNRHSQIEVFKLSDKRKLGNIMLKAKDSSDKLDYAFYYEDGSFIFLEDLLLTVEKILNIKK
jgi:hypothetical protein